MTGGSDAVERADGSGLAGRADDGAGRGAADEDSGMRSPRAGSFIVTVYGDAVEPRGGRAWIGNVIESCAGVGISETLVRTAVHRLVAAGRLVGEREGRRSYYSLTRPARAEFRIASDALFGADARDGWAFVWLPPAAAEDAAGALAEAGFVRLSADWLAGPAVSLPDLRSALVFGPVEGSDPALLPAFAAAHWDLSAHAAAYEDFLGRFAAHEAEAAELPPAAALRLRLLLVHAFRRVALKDPRLPAAALPADWPGPRARRLFARLYLDLSPAADARVAERFLSGRGALPLETPATRQRLASLARIADRPG